VKTTGALRATVGGSETQGVAPTEPAEPSRTVGQFGSRGTGAGELREPVGIAVDRRNGDIYVVDTDNFRIDKFTSAGKFLLAWGWAVADSKTKALQTCTKKCYEGIEGEGSGQLQFPQGLTVDNDPSSPSYGDVYVVDISNQRVQKFGPTGKFLLMFGGSVNHTADKAHDHAEEDVCPVHTHDVCGKGTEGSTGGQLEYPVVGSFITVSHDGTVYIGQRNSIKTYSPQGIYKSQIKLTPLPKSSEGRESGGVSGLAVNAAGDMYVIRNGIVGVNEYTPSGQLLRTLEPGGEPAYPEGPAPSLALDPAGNIFIDVYANNRHRIDEYNSGGAKIASFDKGPPESPPSIVDKEDGLPGMAYDIRTNKLYVVNADVNVKPVVTRIRIIDPPTVATQASTLPSTTTTQQAQPIPKSARAAEKTVLAHDYTPNDITQYHPNQTLRVLTGTLTGTADGFRQKAFFFNHEHYIGTDTKGPSITVKVASQSNNKIALSYPLYYTNENISHPHHFVTVTYQLQNNHLTHRGKIPPPTELTASQAAPYHPTP
jgi:hypothetical protein